MKFEGTIKELTELYSFGIPDCREPLPDTPAKTQLPDPSIISWIDKRKEDLKAAGMDPNLVYAELEEMRTELQPGETIEIINPEVPYLPGWKLIENFDMKNLESDCICDLKKGELLMALNVEYPYILNDEQVGLTFEKTGKYYLFERVDSE